jgi:L-threonylcarbamoyladenylate synthase
MPSHRLTLALLNEIEFPLAAPSANPFGYISPTTAQHVADQLGNKVSFILDGGLCEIGLESTILGFIEGRPILYRLGGIPQEDIERITGPLTAQLNQSSDPSSPGQLSSHYAPRKPLLLGNIDELRHRHNAEYTGIIRFMPVGDEHWALSTHGDLFEAARNLFHILRLADNSLFDILLAEPVPDIGIGRAINDRLRRASAR